MKIDLLDHGYLEFKYGWGSDADIIEAARMSTDKGFLGWGTPEAPGDEKLLNYLWEHAHHSPFEFGGLVLEVQAPIFVFREWHRHRTQSYNELSARYTPLPDMNYIPSVERLMVKAHGTNKQANRIAGAPVLTEEFARYWLHQLERIYAGAQGIYEEGLGLGVPKELARIGLPFGRYSRMRACANLRNWLAFTTLRSDPNAQWEIQVYSDAVRKVIEQQFPRTYDVYMRKLYA